MVTATAEEKRFVRACQLDPVLFYQRVLGCSLFDKQEEIVRSVVHNRRTAVVGANSTGKDYTTGRLILWWLNCVYPSKVVLTGPTFRQVDDIVWRETRSAYRTRVGPLAGRMYDKDLRYEIEDEWFAVGFSTDDPNNLQGFHSPHLLVIVTEAHGMPQNMMDAVKRLNPERLVLTGNPLAIGGEFYDAFHENRDLYNCITISAFDTPNMLAGRNIIPGMVTMEDVQERATEYGTDSPMYRTSVLSEFPDDLEDVLVPLASAMAAVAADLTPSGHGILGVDVARYGEDASVVTYRRGPRVREVYRSTKRSTMDLVGQTLAVAEADANIEVVIIDDTGVGGGVTDRMREVLRGTPLGNRVRVVPFIAGGRARSPKRFFNRTAEAWWLMGQAFRQGEMDIDDNRKLIGQVTTRQYNIQSDKTIRLETKEEMRKAGRRSPDEADSLAMTFDPAANEIQKPAQTHDLLGLSQQQARHPLGLDMSQSRYQDTDRRG